MKSTLINLRALLKGQPLIEAQINFYLFAARVRLPFTRYYDNLQAQQKSSQNHIATLNHQASLVESSQWDWRGLPDEWPLARLWSLCSTAWMCVVIMKTLFSEQLFALAHLLTGWPGHCVIMGRFVLHPSLSALTAFLFAALHLSWRYMQQLKTRAYMLGNFSFLLQTERDLEHFLKNRKLHNSPISNHELFLRHIMCFEVHLESGRVVYKLRPNRRWQSRSTLIDSLVRASLASGCVFLTLAIPSLLTIILLLLSDLRFIQTYPRCQPHLDYLYTSGQLKSFWSWTFSGYRLISLLFDLVENFLIWIDSGVAFVFVPTLIYLINCDVLLYWHHLDRLIRIILFRVRAHYLQNVQLIDSSSHGKRSTGSGSRASARLERDRRQLETELNELHFGLIDFFQQVKEADKIVGEVLTMTIVYWLIGLALTNYYYLVRIQSDLPALVKWMQFSCLLVISLATHYILKLHRCCMRSYQLLCSLIAFDQSNPNRKLRFVTLMDFFIKRQATAYTLFQSVPYLAITYLKLIGWSFSLVVVSYGLFDRESPLSRWKTASSERSDVLILGGPKYSAFSSSLQ